MEERAQSRTCPHSCCVCAYPVSLESLSVSGLIQFTYLRNLLELLLSSARYSFPSILPNLTNLPINWDWNGRLGQGLIYIPGSAPLELDCQPLPTFLSRLVCIFCPFFHSREKQTLYANEADYSTNGRPRPINSIIASDSNQPLKYAN